MSPNLSIVLALLLGAVASVVVVALARVEWVLRPLAWFVVFAPVYATVILLGAWMNR